MTTPHQNTRAEHVAVEQAFRDVARSIRGELIFPGDGAYDASRRVWNATIDRHPLVIGRCAGRDEVVTLLRVARQHGVPIAVRGGGHSFAGHSTCDRGVVIDLSAMKDLTVDADRRVAVAGPGLTWGELVDVTQQHGLAAVGGTVSLVGIAGLTLGGGVGWLARAHGLACDNVLGFEVVTADGSVVHASADEHPELFWGLRGGGGNFGIVTRLTLRLHPVGPLFCALAMYSGNRAPQVLRSFRDFVENAPDAVSVMAGLLTAPPAPFVPPEMQGKPAILVGGCYVGPMDEGDAALAPLRMFGAADADLSGPMPFARLQHVFDEMIPPTMPVHLRSELIGHLDDAAIDVLSAATAQLPSPLSNVLLVPLGGAVRSVPPDASAFAHRDASYNIEIGASWLPGDDALSCRRWADACWQAIRPWSAGVHINHVGDEGADRLRDAYPEPTYARLAELKRTYDPDNVFRLNHNIRPAP